MLLCCSIATFGQLDTAIVRTYGGPYYEEGRQIIECAEGGYAVIGTTGSDQLNNTNFYLLRLDEELNCMWSQNYGGSEVEWGYSLVEDANNNLIICGYTNSYGEGGYDILVYKVNLTGEVIWQKTYGGSDWDFAYKIIAHPTGGYLICGKTYSYGNGGSDAYLLHINDDGNLLNEWTYGGEGDDEFVDIGVNNDASSLICFGTSTNILSNNQEVSYLVRIFYDGTLFEPESFFDYESLPSSGVAFVTKENRLILLFKFYYNDSWSNWCLRILDEFGNIVDQQTSHESEASSLLNTPDDGFILAGTTNQFGLGGNGIKIEKRNSGGWYEAGPTFGTSLDEEGYSLLLNNNEQPILLGKSNGFSIHNNFDIYIVLFRSFSLSEEYTLNQLTNVCFDTDIEVTELSHSPLAFVDKSNILRLNSQGCLPLSIYDINGKLVFRSLSYASTFSLSSLNSGLYIVVFDNLNYKSLKIIIQ